ncbi:MAG: hypothetical protein ACXAAI_09775 [Promethearchaeota archaeon]|jgi:hypothetical protein
MDAERENIGKLINRFFTYMANGLPFRKWTSAIFTIGFFQDIIF